jgi:2-keto-4-pentenoate hydratase/2-oxohepta-3-ene-1,7-dioic acid hydratase in catechol pathway
MKYCRFNYGNETLWGALEGETVHALASAPWPEEEKTGETFSLDDVRLLAPTVPTKIVCVGRNYKAHAAELGNPLPEQPLIFLKPPSSVIGPGEAIIYPAQSQRVDYEGELGLVIGRRCRNAKRDKALDHLFGLTCLIDVSARDLQKIDKHFARGKGFDTFCPLGPVVATGLDPFALTLETRINGERRQHAPVTDMIFPLDVIIEFISAVMTLEPGDVIATGTPAGVGPLAPGDTVEVEIKGIGTLRNTVAK